MSLLTVANTATDSDTHSTVVYSLLNPPAGVVISASGVITWTPTQAESHSTNTITTVATSTDTFDQVNPQLSVTNIFTVIVLNTTNITPPILTITRSGNSVIVSWPYPSTGWTLQQNSNLTTSSWSTSSGVSNNGTNNFIIITSPTGNLFFRLTTAAQQTNIYLYTGYETNITLAAGTYNITAYGAQGGNGGGGNGGLGAEMEGQFNFVGVTTLTLLVGGAGIRPDNGGNNVGGGGGGSFIVNNNTPLIVAGAGGGGGYSGTGTGGIGLTGTTGGIGGGGGGTGGSGGGGGGYGDGNLPGGAGGGGYSGNGGGGGTGNVGGGQSFINGGGGGGGGYIGGGYGGGGGGNVGGGGGGGYSGGGGGGSFGNYGGSNYGGGGGGGSIIDSSAITILAEVSGVASPDGSPNGEIIITLVSH